jgi:hypothetical protein
VEFFVSPATFGTADLPVNKAEFISALQSLDFVLALTFGPGEHYYSSCSLVF